MLVFLGDSEESWRWPLSVTILLDGGSKSEEDILQLSWNKKYLGRVYNDEKWIKSTQATEWHKPLSQETV